MWSPLGKSFVERATQTRTQKHYFGHPSSPCLSAPFSSINARNHRNKLGRGVHVRRATYDVRCETRETCKRKRRVRRVTNVWHDDETCHPRLDGGFLAVPMKFHGCEPVKWSERWETIKTMTKTTRSSSSIGISHVSTIYISSFSEILNNHCFRCNRP